MSVEASHPEEKKTYPCDLNARAEMRSAVDLSAMESSKDAAKVRGKGREHLRAFAAHAHKTNG